MKKGILLIVLLFILIGGGFVLINVIGKNSPSIQKIFNKKQYEKYNAGDVVQFANERWYVLYDSDKDSDYVTLISSDIEYIDDEKLSYVVSGVYETSYLNDYLSEEYVNELGANNFVEINGYKARLFNSDDMKMLDVKYDEENDQYEIIDCPEYICLTNSHFATMIDTDQQKEFVDVYNNVSDIENILYGDYVLHLKYYNLSCTYETYYLESLVDDATLFVRPVINVYKSSVENS